jgi:trans-2,3-dihydro-3-hydroxyanthranilate isomerase
MATSLAYRIVDVFSAKPLAGNALCVVLDPCPTEFMAPLAREVNLSETTFPVITGPDTYDVRIFAPSTEMPFAGHPTLGTAWTLGPGRWTQTSPGATVAVDVDGEGARMTQPVPSFTVWDPAPAVGALGLAGPPDGLGCWVAEAGGLRHLVVVTEAPIGSLTPDMTRLVAAGRAAAATTLAAVARRDDATLHVRVFVPGAGIAEDPGTGSAAGPIAVLARQQWRTDRTVTISQGDEIGRPCRIEVTVPDEGGPMVGGRVAACAEGRFTL